MVYALAPVTDSSIFFLTFFENQLHSLERNVIQIVCVTATPKTASISPHLKLFIMSISHLRNKRLRATAKKKTENEKNPLFYK